MSLKLIRSKPKPILPPTYLLIALLLMLGLDWIFPGIHVVTIPWNLLGLLFLGVGVWVAYAAEAQFHRAKTAVNPYEEPTILVRDGMYKFSRNPMYLGFAGVLLGVAFLLGSLTPFLVIPGFVALIHKLFIQTEERILEKIYQNEWQDYVQKVRRWI